ncbi:MAG TPA: toll/interleukin-1 receptor domain-containing protein [Aggregatilineales bacterium]|nr:toll/interleukin-1 receptor domain-containing protein [Aggregatilineales bacterium]
MDGTGLFIAIVIGLVIVGAAIFVVSRRRGEGSGTREETLGNYKSRPAPSAPPPPAQAPSGGRKREAKDLFGDTEVGGPPAKAPGGSASYGSRAVPPASAPRPAPRPAAAPPPAPPAPPVASPAPAKASVPQPAPRRQADPSDETLLSETNKTGPLPPQQATIPSGLAAAPQPAPAPAAAVPMDDVHFTSFHPKEAVYEQWYTLLVYAHVASALARVQADAGRFKDEMGADQRQAQGSAPAQIARGTEITILPEMAGVEFNPERITFKWVEDMHRAEFRMRPHADAGPAGSGTITILIGPVIVGVVKFGMLFSASAPVQADTFSPVNTVTPINTVGSVTPGAAQLSQSQMAQATASMYHSEQIFISYSHKDTPVALACRNVYKALGWAVLIDVDTLRSGEVWNDALMGMIDRADIFQLFWSENSAQSQYCKQEWEYALKNGLIKGGAFIRPVYWKQPLVPPPQELEPLHFAYIILPEITQP